MKNVSTAQNRKGLWLSFATLGLIGSLFATLPLQSSIKAFVNQDEGIQSTSSHKPRFEYYDIRTDKTAAEKLEQFRAASGRSARAVADERQKMVIGEETLRRHVPTLTVEYNEDIRTPEVIAPDVKQGRAFLSGARATGKNSDTLRQFIKENNDLTGMSDAQADTLRVTADYTNPNGDLAFAQLEQFINNIPVFRGEIKAGFTRSGEMFRVINNLAPSLDAADAPTDFGSPENAVRAAFNFVPREIKAEDTDFNSAASTDLKAVFGANDWATTAEKMYFPIDSGVARAAWRVLVWEDVAAYYVIVDAETGAMLWRKNIANDQSQAVTYNVYANTTSMIKSLDSPAPLTPGILDPSLATQGTLANRTNVTLIGNEAPYTFNNNGWITDGNNTTDGNNVEAGVDRVTPNGVDAPVTGSGNRVFNFNYTPGNGNNTPPLGDDPLGAEYQKGIGTHLFYVTNRYHDELYLLGFTEQAKNFQHDNFGRGGLGNDRVSAEGQDSSGTNNANFNTPCDGSRGRMQMYLWTPPTPDRDGDLDADIIIHELTHGTSNRLHGGCSGLTTTMAGGMGEGWSDWYAHALLSEPTDPINGVYTTGGYSTLSLRTAAPFSSFGNYYYGIRAFPKAVRAFTGGPNNRPHNPLTFADIDSTTLNVNDGAFAPAFAPSTTSVHFVGEVWSSNLWEVRAKLIQRLGPAAGNRKALQLVTDGMKLAPLNPTFIQERDAILAAALASSSPSEAALDVADVWAGFAVRGMGFSARVISSSPVRVTEAFDLPNVQQLSGFTVSDASGNNNGVPEPGETLTLTVPLTNATGNTVTGVTLQVVGGGSANYGDIANGQTVSRNVTYTIPANTPCGASVTITFNVTSSVGTTSFTKVITTGTPISTPVENFDGVTAPALPAGWTTTQTGSGTAFVTSTATPDSAPNAAFTTDPATAGGAELVSPAVNITSAQARVSFRNNYNTEADWDGGVLEISINGGAFQDVITAGGSFVTGGYNGQLGTAATNPLSGRQAWTGNSNGYITSIVQLPAAANGQPVRLKFRHGTDTSIGGAGWRIDNIQIINGYNCAPVTPTAPTNSRADFDGDGKTDVSVFRAGNWFVQRSTAGFAGVQWGAAGDTTVPADYDGDNKTDYAIFRPSAVAGVADFYVINSANNTFSGVEWGTTGDIPVVGDYTGDNKEDFAVVRPATYTWYILPAGGGAPIIGSVGQVCDRPVVGDFDGDGKADIAGIQGSNWIVRNSTNNTVSTQQWGLSSDRFVPADYDNDNKDDYAVFRSGVWYIRRSTNGQLMTIDFGQTGDVAVPGDYDGDGADDAAVFRNGVWFINRSTAGSQAISFGQTGDTAIPNRYLPQ